MKPFLFVAAATLAAAAYAGGAEMSAVKNHNMVLGMSLDTCVTEARTVFVLARSGAPADTRELDTCISRGKDAAKVAYADVKAALKDKPPPQALADWRVEWATAFDTTALQAGEAEAGYLRRVGEVRSSVRRATNKLEIAFE